MVAPKGLCPHLLQLLGTALGHRAERGQAGGRSSAGDSTWACTEQLTHTPLLWAETPKESDALQTESASGVGSQGDHLSANHCDYKTDSVAFPLVSTVAKVNQ